MAEQFMMRKNSDWAQTRLEILRRDRFRCRMCGRLVAKDFRTAEQFGLTVAHVHHIRPRGLGGGKRDDSPGNLITLCGKCHAVETARQRRET